MRDVHWMAVCAQGSEVWRPAVGDRLLLACESRPGCTVGQKPAQPWDHCLMQRHKQVWDLFPSPFILLFKWSLCKHLPAHLFPWWVGRKARDLLYSYGSVIFYFYGNESNSYVNPGYGKQGSLLLEIFCATNYHFATWCKKLIVGEMHICSVWNILLKRFISDMHFSISLGMLPALQQHCFASGEVSWEWSWTLPSLWTGLRQILCFLEHSACNSAHFLTRPYARRGEDFEMFHRLRWGPERTWIITAKNSLW